MKNTEGALKWMVELLNRKNIPYQISGGFAAKIYGSKRPINDIDFDIPENRFTDILDEVKPYIINELTHYVDGKWDLQVMTLVYQGQEIDIGGAYEAKVSTKDRTSWISIPADLSKVRKIEVGGIIVNVISPERLIAYKQHLDGDHQIEDIKAVKKYIKEHA